MTKRTDSFTFSTGCAPAGPAFTYDYEDGELKCIHIGDMKFVPAVPASDKLSDDAENGNVNVTSPKHYISPNGLECIDAIKASMSSAEFAGYLRGNVMKYIWRFRKKGGVEDLKKACWYLDKLLEEEIRNA